MIKSEEYKRGYDAGYKQALLDALQKRSRGIERDHTAPDAFSKRRADFMRRAAKLLYPDDPISQREFGKHSSEL